MSSDPDIQTGEVRLRVEPYEPVVPPGIDDEFEAARRDQLLQRLPITIIIYLAMVGAATVAEGVLRPDIRPLLGFIYLIHMTVALIALTLARFGRPGIETVFVALGCTSSLLLSMYSPLIIGNPERVASGQICLLYGLFFLVPWGWRSQLKVGCMALLGIVMFDATTGLPEELAFGVIVILTGTITSVGGSYYLDRYRRDHFLRNAQLTQTSAEKQEEAEVSAQLLHVAETLSANIDEPDLLARITRVAVDIVGCDWGSTFVLDERDEFFRLGACFGASPRVLEEMDAVAFNAENLPLVGALRPDVLIEMEDVAQQDLIPPALLAQWEVASQIVAPILAGGEVVGALCLAYRTRQGAFSERERRLARGVTHFSAFARSTSQLIDELRDASALRSEFVSTMSHELRTPINVILGFTEMAKDDALPPEEHAASLRRVERAAQDLLRLIEDTLAMGRIDANQISHDFETVDIGATWDGLGREFASLPGSSEVTLDWVAVGQDAQVVTDPRKLAIITRNLVHNALKFTEHGSVRAELQVLPSSICIVVADTGIGIADADQNVIFDMFRQADGSDSRRFGGTGLGLHIVRRFVDQLGGTIDLESAPGVGSTFTVTLPYAGERSAEEIA